MEIYQALAFIGTLSFAFGENNVIENFVVTNFGYWGDFDNCSDGLLVTGFQLKVEPYRRRPDNTALNGIKLFCGNSIFKSVEEVSSFRGPFGQYWKPKYCSSYATGFKLSSQEYQGRNKDDVAATNFDLICADGKELNGFAEPSRNEYKNLTSSGDILCPEGTGICGIQTQVEFHQGWGDDTALNNVKLKCCNIPVGVVTPSSPTVPETTAQTGPESTTTSGEPVTQTNSGVGENGEETTPIIIIGTTDVPDQTTEDQIGTVVTVDPQLPVSTTGLPVSTTHKPEAEAETIEITNPEVVTEAEAETTTPTPTPEVTTETETTKAPTPTTEATVETSTERTTHEASTNDADSSSDVTVTPSVSENTGTQSPVSTTTSTPSVDQEGGPDETGNVST